MARWFRSLELIGSGKSVLNPEALKPHEQYSTPSPAYRSLVSVIQLISSQGYY